MLRAKIKGASSIRGARRDAVRYAALHLGHYVAARKDNLSIRYDLGWVKGLSDPLTAADVARLRRVALSLLVTVVFSSKEQARMYARDLQEIALRCPRDLVHTDPVEPYHGEECGPQIFPGDYDPDEDLGRPPEPKEAPFEALDIATHPVAIHRLVEDISWTFLGSPPEKVPIVADIDDLDNMLGMSKQLRNYLEGGRRTISGVPLVNITLADDPAPEEVVVGPDGQRMVRVHLVFFCIGEWEARAVLNTIHWKPGTVAGADGLSWKVPIHVSSLARFQRFVAHKNEETSRLWVVPPVIFSLIDDPSIDDDPVY